MQDITLKDGTVLKGAVITEPTPVTMTIRHEDGVVKVPVANMPDALMEKYHYTPELRAKWEEENAAAAEQKNPLLVENIALKLVEVDGLFGKSERFRYFFRVRNVSRVPFSGKVEIGLFNQGVKGVVTKVSFTMSMEPGFGTVVYIDSHSGPRSFHGDYSIRGCRFSVDGGAEMQAVTLEELATLEVK